MPDYSVTLGPEVAAVATLAGFPPDPEQRMLLDAAFAIDKHGKSVAFEVVVIAPRQNLKTGFFKQVALGQLFVRDERLVVWSAHEFDTAQEALRDIEALIESSETLSRRVKRLTHGAVPEIELVSGARLKFKTRTSGGGRGLSGRKVFLDEGYALQPSQVGALMPVMLAQPDPQVYYGSSACRPESAVLWDVVQRGRLGNDPRLVYAEWCTPEPKDACDRGAACNHSRTTPGCGCDKPELLLRAHSAVTRGRILLDTIIDLRKTMPPEEYGREVMGWHDEPLDAGEPAIDLDAWADCTDPHSAVETVAAFGVAVSLDRAWAAVVAAGTRPDGRGHLEVVNDGHRPGVDWVLTRCRVLARNHPRVPFAVDSGGPAAGLIDQLEAAGCPVVSATTKDVGTAAAAIVDSTQERVLLHGPQPDLDAAVAAAKRRNIGDGMFAFGRRASGTDISPLEAGTLAWWVASQAAPTSAYESRPLMTV